MHKFCTEILGTVFVVCGLSVAGPAHVLVVTSELVTLPWLL